MVLLLCHAGLCIRKAIATRGAESRFHISENRMAHYKSAKSAIGRLLSRCNLIMSDTLHDILAASLREYADYIVRETRFAVVVEGSNRVRRRRQ